MLKDKIRAARKAAGKTQKEMAMILGITESTYCGYETGKRQPDAVKVAAIAAALGVSGDYLLDIPETIKPEKPNNEGLMGYDVPMESDAAAAPELSPDEAELLDIFRSLQDQERALILATARAIKK